MKNRFSNKGPQSDKPLCHRRAPNWTPSDLPPHQPAAARQFKKTVLKGPASLTKKVGEIDWYLEFSGLLWVFLGFCD